MFNLKIVKTGNTSIAIGHIPAENTLSLAHDTAELFKYAEPYGKSKHRLSVQFGKPYSFGSKTYQDRTNQENQEILLRLFNLAKSIVPNAEYNGIHINYYQPALLEANHDSMLGWHTDAEDAINNSVPILSLSIGTSMTFQIKDTTGIYDFETGEGTIMLFDGRVEHRVLRQKHTGVRVNITFRKHF